MADRTTSRSDTTSSGYQKRSRIEIMVGQLKDWRRVSTRYNRRPTASFAAALAATNTFCL